MTDNTFHAAVRAGWDLARRAFRTNPKSWDIVEPELDDVVAKLKADRIPIDAALVHRAYRANPSFRSSGERHLLDLAVADWLKDHGRNPDGPYSDPQQC